MVLALEYLACNSFVILTIFITAETIQKPHTVFTAATLVHVRPFSSLHHMHNCDSSFRHVSLSMPTGSTVTVLIVVDPSLRFAVLAAFSPPLYLSVSVFSDIVTSLVISRLDYCNGVFHRLPATDVRRLQSVQNATVRLVFNLPFLT